MLSRILVGVDGRSGGWGALDLARRLTWPHDAELVVVSAFCSAAAEHRLVPWRGPTDRAAADRVLQRAHEHLGSATNVRFVAAAADLPGSTLQELVVEHRADLLVVGRTTRGGVARALGADVVAQALCDPPCPVAVAPPRYRIAPEPLGRVAVASGPGDESLAAVRWALALGEHAEEEIAAPELVHIDPVADGVLPAAGLRDLSADVDLLVLGTHGRGRFGRAVHGSVALDVVRHAACPVVAVPIPRTSRTTTAP